MTHSNIRPQELKVKVYGNKIEISTAWNITEVEDGFEFGHNIKIVDKTTRDSLIAHLIHLRYNQDAEFSLVNKGIQNPLNEEYVSYRNYVELCKIKATEIFEGE